MPESVILQAEARSAVGTHACRALRRGGRLPAVIYGHGEAVEPISLDRHAVEVALSHGTHVVDVDLGRKKQHCLIRDVQYDHLSTTPIHLDLTRVDVHERVRVTVGIELRGTPKGVAHGGVLDLQMSAIELECAASAIPETLRPVVTDLEVGQSLAVKDLVLPPGVTALADPEDRIVTIHAPTKEVAPVEEAVSPEEAAAVAEPERIGRVRKEEDEA